MGAKKINDWSEEINFDEITEPEISSSVDTEMMAKDVFEELIKHLTASPPRRATRVKLKLSALLHGKRLLSRVNLVSLSSRALGIDRKVSIEHGETCYITIPTDPPVTLKCLPIVGSVEFGLGHWDRLLILTEFKLEKIIRLLYEAVRREAQMKK